MFAPTIHRQMTIRDIRWREKNRIESHLLLSSEIDLLKAEHKSLQKEVDELGKETENSIESSHVLKSTNALLKVKINHSRNK